MEVQSESRSVALEAVDQKTCNLLQHFDIGDSSQVSPLSYALNGRHYVAMIFAMIYLAFPSTRACRMRLHKPGALIPRQPIGSHRR
jgi:hypothetical protein